MKHTHLFQAGQAPKEPTDGEKSNPDLPLKEEEAGKWLPLVATF